jgi:hypothetical protein
MNGERGSIFAGTLVLMTILFSGVGAILLYTSGTQNLIERYRVRYARENEAGAILSAVTASMQSLVNDDADTERGNNRAAVLSAYEAYHLDITDISTGINTKLLSERILNTEAVRDALRADRLEVTYGWISAQYGSEKIIEAITKRRTAGKIRSVFPLINSFPLININTASEVLLSVLLQLSGIEAYKDKAYILKIKSSQSELADSDIAEILGVGTGHPVMGFLGVKTAFWKASFFAAGCTVDAVYAAVPYEKEFPRKVEKYILIEKHIRYKGERGEA